MKPWEEGRDGQDAFRTKNPRGGQRHQKLKKPRKDPPSFRGCGDLPAFISDFDPHTVIFFVPVTLPRDSDAISQIGNWCSCQVWLVIFTSQEHFCGGDVTTGLRCPHPGEEEGWS